jgi:alkaline phosphatase
MRLTILAGASLVAVLAGCAAPPPAAPPAAAASSAERSLPAERPKNVLFFLGDGMGINTLTAARIFAVGEDGSLAIDTLPESAFVKTFSTNAQVTDSAASMSAYMTGVKQENGMISMAADTRAVAPAAGDQLASHCANGRAAITLAELAKQRGMAAGVVTTTSVTDATPAATYAHVCHRSLEADIAAALVPGGAGYNPALGAGLDLVLGGGAQFFRPLAQGGKRSDGRDLLGELGARGYRVVTSPAQLNALAPQAQQPVIGLFAPNELAWEAVRDPAAQPSLAEMTTRAINLLAQRPNGFFLMVEGGLIDRALHATLAKRALQETVSYDAALKAAIDRMQQIDPGLKNTLIIATADHDHTLLLNGYSPRTGKTTPASAGVLGLARNVSDHSLRLDKDGVPYTIIGFGTGEHRVEGSRAAAGLLTDDIARGDDYHQEAAIRMKPGGETHGGTDVYLGAMGAGAEIFRGTIDNTRVFSLIREATGW